MSEQNKLSSEQKEFLIAQALESPRGREALAQAMANPARGYSSG